VGKTGTLVALSVVFAVLAVGACGKKPKPEVTPATEEVPEEEVAPPEQTAPPETTEVQEEAPTEEEISVLLKDIHFDFDDDRIREDAKKILNRNAEVLMKYPWVKVLIEGHCDERGTVEYNLALGERRAMNAKKYLVSYGIDPSRISIISYGEEKPLDPRHNEEAWAKNRRAHFVVKK